MSDRHPMLQAAVPRWGGLRLIGLRVLTLALPFLLSMLAVQGDLTPWSARPWFHESLDLYRLLQWFGEAFDGIAGTLFRYGVLGFLLDQIVTTGAIRWLDPRVERPRFTLVGPAVLGEGTRYLWPLLRTLVPFAVLGIGGAAALQGGLGYLGTQLDDPRAALAAGGVLAVLWMSLISGLSHLAQVVVVGTGRRVVLRGLWITLRLAWRHKLLGVFPYAAAAAVFSVAPGALLIGWRAANPADGYLPWLAGWGGLLVLQAVVWHYLIQLAWQLLVRHPDLMEEPDEGFGRLKVIDQKLEAAG